MNTYRHCLPRWTGGHIASPHSLVWKKAFLSGLCSTTTLLNVNFWTRAVGLCLGWLSRPPTCPHGKSCSQATEASLLNCEPWGSATAQATTLRVQNKSTLVESSTFKKSVSMTVSSATWVTYEGVYISFMWATGEGNQAARGAHTKYFDLIICRILYSKYQFKIDI